MQQRLITGFTNRANNLRDGLMHLRRNQPSVINAASDLLVEVFGEAGKHTRLALGSNVLPLNACVEISATFALEPA